MSWSGDSSKTTLKSPVSEQINKVSNILSAPSRCSSRYPYMVVLTNNKPCMAMQPSSIGRCTTMGEV